MKSKLEYLFVALFIAGVIIVFVLFSLRITYHLEQDLVRKKCLDSLKIQNLKLDNELKRLKLQEK